MRPVRTDSTDISVVIRIVDSADGTPETAVVAATPGLAFNYRREGGLSLAISAGALSDLAALNSAHADGGIKHIGDGYYRVDVRDNAFVADADGVLITGTATDMVVIGTYILLFGYSPRTDMTAARVGYLDALDTGVPLADDAITAAKITADAVTKIQSGLSTLTAAQVKTQADAALTDYGPPTNAQMEARTLAAANYATAANQTTLLNRIGAFTGSGVNTILGFLKAAMSKIASTPSDVGGTFDPATDSLEALQENQEGIDTDVWTYATRRLTQTAASVTSTLSGSTVTILRGDTLSLSMTDLGSLSGYVSLDFTVKQKKSDDDNDALVRIRKNASGVNDGLLRFNKAESGAGGGNIAIDDAGDGDITITLVAGHTDDLSIQSNIYYDVQMITASAVTTLTSGTCHISADVTRAIA